ncbi:metallophosphoesterase [Rhodopirellula baltica]
MAIWFTADTHFNHPEIIGYSRRPFASAQEMDKTMVQRWNAAIHPGDTVYHLGDFALTWGRDDAGLVDSPLVRLNGTKHLISGNHDRREVCKSRGWAKVSPYHEIKVDTGGPAKHRIVMCHYALRIWNGMRTGAWLLYGHS